MWIAEIAERSILAAMSDVTCAKRASRVDDEPTQKKEHAAYPAMVIMASGGMLSSSPQSGAKFYDLPCSVKLITHYTDDPKMTALAALEDSFRMILDQGLETEFNAVAVANGDRWHYVGLIEITGEQVEKTKDEQGDRTTELSIETTMTFKVCGSIT